LKHHLYEIYHDDKSFFKLYQFNDHENYVNFILEITFQIYAYYNLQDYSSERNIILTTPKILRCYKTEKFRNLDFIETLGASKYNYVFYIEMERAEGETLKNISLQLKNQCNLFIGIIQKLDIFLKEHGIFHNDLNMENILIKISNGKIEKITIIDFGQSLDKPHIDPRAQFKYNCNLKKGVVLKNRTLF
jgi:serine/threonine protein kinase